MEEQMERVNITQQDLKAALPDVTSPLTLPGLKAPIDIYRDRWGIPHVHASSSEDAFFGQGFATAQDRLWHMDYDRHRACGRWAELAGKQAVEGDKVMRRFRLKASAEADWAVLQPDTRAMFEAFAKGVNAFIKSTKSLPIEYKLLGIKPEPWTPVDSLAVYKVRHALMGTFEEKLWRGLLVAKLGPDKAASLLPDYPKGGLMIVPPGTEYLGSAVPALEELRHCTEALNWLREAEFGSNSWAITVKRSRTGKPFVCGDSHRALDTPSVYYQMHIACPDFDAIGFSFPGVPGFPHFGHNEHVAWCVTHACADYQDLYVERFKESDPTRYLFKSRWRKAEVHHETIEVRGAEPVRIDVTVTEHGPVIAGNPARGHAITIKYTATESANNWADALLKQLYVRSVDDLEETMRIWVDPGNNYVFGDVRGNACYLTRGKVPIRSAANRWIPVPGWTGEHEWEGYVPFEAMPRVRNPEVGYIVTANNRIVEKHEPYYIGMDYVSDFRARRIYERLRNLTGAGADEMASVHAERVSIPGQTYARLLRNVKPLDNLSARAKELLLKWGGQMDRDRIEPTIYSAFHDRLVRIVLRPIFGSLAAHVLEGSDRGGPRHVQRLRALFPVMIEQDDRSLLPAGANWHELMSKALSEGVAYLSKRLGSDMSTWKWGRVHVTRPQHPLSASFPQVATLLNPPSVSTHGDGDTPLQGGYSGVEPYIVAGLSVNRYIYDLDNLKNSRWSVPLGSSGHPGSSHYADQAPIWADVHLIPMLYDWDAIRSEAETHQTLNPKER
jgi:penicillin amidase